jgi:hypothetical protein
MRAATYLDFPSDQQADKMARLPQETGPFVFE